MNKVLKPLLKTLSKNEFCTEQNVITNHCIDWRGKFKGTAELIFFPKNVKSVIKIIKFCYKNKISVVPQGGNTSLVGGSVPRSLHDGRIEEGHGRKSDPVSEVDLGFTRIP